MTSNEIRGVFTPYFRNDDTAQLLIEIAAQLAEHNERCAPRLVEFTYKGKPFSINVKEVSAVGQQTDAGKCYIAVCGRPFTCDQTYEEVLTKLGIEVNHAKH